MTLQAIQVLFQSISSLAIAGGLIYTAFQFRNYRRATHVANFTKLVELQMQLRRMRVEDPSLAEVYAHDTLGMKSQRDVQFYFFNLMQLSVFEIVWFSYLNHQLPPAYYQSWVDRMRVILAEDSFKAMMASPSMKILHGDFHRYIVELMHAPVSGAAPRPVAPTSPPEHLPR